MMPWNVLQDFSQLLTAFAKLVGRIADLQEPRNELAKTC